MFCRIMRRDLFQHTKICTKIYNKTFSENMPDGYMSRQKDIIITTNGYLFAQQQKKPFKLPSRATFAIAKFLNF